MGRKPSWTKDHQRYHKLEEEGEERLKSFVNARHIMGVLDEHHKILKQINTTDKKMSDKIFDYVLCLSSGDQSKPKDSE